MAFFLNDLQNTSINKQDSFTDNLEFLWSENNKNSRFLTCQIIKSLTDKPAKIKLVITEVMEATGNATFEVLSQITKHSEFLFSTAETFILAMRRVILLEAEKNSLIQ